MPRNPQGRARRSSLPAFRKARHPCNSISAASARSRSRRNSFMRARIAAKSTTAAVAGAVECPTRRSQILTAPDLPVHDLVSTNQEEKHGSDRVADETCNPLWGCTEGSDASGGCDVIASECDECYAERREQDRV